MLNKEWFIYHKPIGDQQARYKAIREAAHNLATVVDNNCPDSEEKKEAILLIRKAMMMANASIACNKSY